MGRLDWHHPFPTLLAGNLRTELLAAVEQRRSPNRLADSSHRIRSDFRAQGFVSIGPRES